MILPDAGDAKDWLWIAAAAIGWVATVAIMWTKLTGKVNGLGGRAKKNEDNITAMGGRMDHIEHEITEYRRDVQEMGKQIGRLEKAVEGVESKVSDGTKIVQFQIKELERTINEHSAEARERLVRVETVQQIEDKIGPIPTNR